MAQKILIKRGLKSNLPKLDTGELGYTIDTGELFIGGETENNKVVMENDPLEELKIYYSKNDADPDAKYGDCTIIKYKGKVIMIDTGTVLNAQLNTLPLINELGITNIDLFICTHYHHDHILGLEVYKNAGITVDKAIMSLAPARYPTMISARNNALNWLNDMNCNEIVTPTEGMKLLFSDAIELEFFNTDSNFTIYDNGPDEYNNYSLVFYLTYKGRKIFFAGDIEPLAEETLYIQEKIKKVDVLKAPHHGRGDTSYTFPEYKLFYDTLDPEYVMCMNYYDEGLRNSSFATGYLMRYNFHVTNNKHLIMVISGDGNIWLEQGNPYTAGVTLKLTEFMEQNQNSSFATSDVTFDGKSVTLNGLMFLSGAEAETQRIIGWIPDGIPLPKTRKRGPIMLRGRINGEGGLVLIFGYCNVNTDGSVSINPINQPDTWIQAGYICTYSI